MWFSSVLPRSAYVSRVCYRHVVHFCAVRVILPYIRHVPDDTVENTCFVFERIRSQL